MEMRFYWLTVENPPLGMGLGAGITACSEDEAKRIFATAFGDAIQIAKVRVIQTVDEIEQNHVRPNMGNLLVRGIWFPLGHEEVR